MNAGNFPWHEFFALIQQLRWLDVLDVVIVAYLLYRLFLLIRGTRAVQLLRGLILLFLIYYIADKFLQLKIITWIMQNATTMVIVAIPIIFQPELRRALAQLGQQVMPEAPFSKGRDFFQLINILCLTARQLSNHRTGALIVIERNTGLEEFIETGTRIEGIVTSELLLSIFHPGNPLHDGAVIIRGNHVMAAGTLLPLSENIKSSLSDKHHLGTRHRAAIGLSETSDSVCLVVSEETGDISVAAEGKLHRHLNEESLQNLLLTYYQTHQKPSQMSIIQFLFRGKSKLAKQPKDEKNKKELKDDKNSGIYIKRWGLSVIAIITTLALGFILALEQNIFRYEKAFVLPVELRDRIGLVEKGKIAKLDPKYATVKLEGIKKILDTIKPEDIQIYIELKTEKKQQKIEIKTILPNDVVLKSMAPKQVSLSIIK